MNVILDFGKYITNQLQCRLERMERRMSILKQKEDNDLSIKPGEETRVMAKGSSLLPISKGKTEQAQPDSKRKRRRGPKLMYSHKKQHKYPKSAYSTARQEQHDDDSEDDEETDDETSGNEDSQNRTDEESKSADEEEEEDEEESEEPEIDYPMMETESPYHLYYPKHVFSCLESSLSTEKIPHSHNEVETPTWRLRPLTNMYQLEGTENITDEAYYKRHQKFEMEEKRRKRWDMQRLREMRIFEKQQRQKEDEMRASQDETDVETFLPSIHDLTHIEVTESIPVMAFGQPVPFVSPSEFEIPWDMSSSMQSSTRQKTTTHSRRH